MKFPRTPKPSAGFTRLDLAVVLAMCCVLVPVLTVASQRSEEDVRREQCRGNLRQIGHWLTMYAEDHDDSLPLNTSGFWPYELNRSVIGSAAQYGTQPQAFYCPSGDSNGYEKLNFFPEFAVVDYVLTIPGTQGLKSTNINESIIPQPISFGRAGIYEPTAGERELAADVVMSLGNNRETANFTQIVGGTPTAHRTTHLDGDKPSGGSILYLDGHVEWRHFNEMTWRTSANPHFWY